MALFRACQRFQVYSSSWKTFTRLSNSKEGGPRQSGDEPYWVKAGQKETKGFDEIPGPKPFIGLQWLYYNPYLGFYDRERIHHTYAKMYREYGPVIKEPIGQDRVIVHIFHPEDMQCVYRNDGRFPNRLSHQIMARYRKERPDLYDSPGLGPSNGEEWSKFRNEFVKANNVNLVKGLGQALESISDDLVTRVQSLLDGNGEVDVMPILFRWTLEGVGMATLKRRLGCLDEMPNPQMDWLIQASHIANDVVYRTEMMASGHEEQYQRLIPAANYFASVVRRYTDAAIEELPTSDNLFLRAILKPETNKKDLYTYMLDLFHAGIHTTAVTTAFALYHLALNKEVQEKLRSELLRVLPNKDTKLDGSGFVKIEYLTHVIMETMRLNPPTIGNGRVLQVPLVLGGYNVPKSTMVLLHHQVASRLEENFGDAHQFIPERFDEREDEVTKNYLSKNRSVTRPFGFGARQCAGQPLARRQMMLAISKFVRNFDISYHHEKIDTVNRLHNEPDKPVMLRFCPLH